MQQQKAAGEKKDLVAVLKDLEDHLRVHHQNATGCIQQAGEARKRLQTRQDLLKNARQPVICVEKRIDEIEAVGDKTPAAEFKDAAEELRLSRALVADLDSGVQGEIAELDGRVDWLLNDSSKKFVSSHDALKEVKQPRNKDLRHDLNLTERKLSEIRTLLTRTTETAPAAASDAFTGPITPRRRINPAFDEAILALQTAAVTPAIPEPAEQPPAIDTTKFESELESLRNQLSEEKTGTESLRQSLTENQSLLEELEARAAAAEANQSAPLQASTGSDLMRRLLRLGPNRREEALQSQAASTALAAESSGYEDGMTGPQMSINELKAIAEKVETSPINGHDQEDDEEVESLRESITERDEKISELESEIRQLTAPIPFPSELRTDEELRASNYAPAVVPGPTILPLTPSEFEPADELNESDASIPIPLPGDIAAEKEPASVLIFRGDDPAIWNSDFHDARGNFALPLDQLPQEIESIRVKRLDTDEFVETPVTRKTLLAGGTKNESRGWSGKGEHYFGSMHLGIFDESLSHDVETKFGSGGWGFGHRYEISSGQAFAWEGKEIPSVRFEITVRTRGTETSSTTQQGIVDDSTGLSRIEEKPTLPDDGLIVFRSNDPTMWNQNAYLGANLRARSLDGLPDGINWLKMTRCDTGESIFARTELDQLRGDGNGAVSGFNGSNELFYGAHHLGVFDGSAKLDVETRFTFGGWGFGHRNSTTDEESQACGWGGEEIAADTVFEIRLFSELPDIGENESVIGGAK